MKPEQPLCWRPLLLATIFLQLATAPAVVFTNDTLLNSFDTNYDGSDIIVTNCTLTVNGPTPSPASSSPTAAFSLIQRPPAEPYRFSAPSPMNPKR
jgi:hypothetical protein